MKKPLSYFLYVTICCSHAIEAEASQLISNSYRNTTNKAVEHNLNSSLPEQKTKNSVSLRKRLKKWQEVNRKPFSITDANSIKVNPNLNPSSRENLLQNRQTQNSTLKQQKTWSQRLKSEIINNNSPITQNSPEIDNSETAKELQKETQNFSVFPVGLNVGKRNIDPSVMIRGQEDGIQAINFNNWLIPFDAIVEGLNLTVTSQADGQLEVRSPKQVIRINPKKLRTDSQLGLVFSIQDLDNLFGIKAKFDIIEYAIVLKLPWLPSSKNGYKQNRSAQTEAPIILEGLPLLSPNNFSFGAIEQKISASSNQNSSTSYRGDFLAVGSAFGGSWFLRTDQPNFQDADTWRIAEAQFYRPSSQSDLILGSQPSFWRSRTGNDYWGFTYIQRQGFTPPQIIGGFVDPRQRLQASQIGRTITGRTQPGTLVRLVEGFGEKIIGEVLVDSDGIYRFENVVNKKSFSSNYRVLLYPEGRLTAQPEIREATYSIVPGQLPAGTSALVFSGGLRRNFENQSLLGNFSDFRGGIAQRWGLSENITVGVGGIYDDSPRGLAELFYRPANFPLQVAVSALSGSKWDINADIRFDPTRNFRASYTADSFSNRFNIDWRIFRNIALFATTDSRSATSGGVQLNFSSKNAFTFARVSLDTENRLRWNLLQRLGRMELNQRGNEIGTLSELSYNFSRDSSLLNLGNSLLLSYETRSKNGFDNLMTMGWRYRSPKRASDGNYLWEAQLGYGIGSQGSGPIATLSTTVLPGILLRGRYQGVTVTSDRSSFNIDLVSSVGLQGGIFPRDRRTKEFRTQGGMLIQPFFDRNSNGKRDRGEKVYTEDAELLVSLNNKTISSLRPQKQGDRILVRLNPGTYRLDLDPAGFPEDWQTTANAYAVNVIPGSYTQILLPLTPAYTISGVITDSQGNPISGARVEAVSTDSQKRLFSITNTAGVYYLERLEQTTYNLLVNDKPVGGVIVKLEADSQGFQELNIQQTQEQEFRAENKRVNQSAIPQDSFVR